MKKITRLLATAVALLWATGLFAGINTTTAWFNNETFESYTPLTDFKAAGTAPWSGWTSSYFVQSQSITASTTGSATGNVLGFGITSLAALTESTSQSGTRTYTKSNFTTLTGGYVYGKTSFFTATGGNSIGTNYSLRNSTGGIVFEFGGMGTTSNNLWITGEPAATIAMGARSKWADIEFVLDLVNNNAVKVIVTYSGTSKPYSNIPLVAGANLNTLVVTEAKGYDAGGLDNTTIAQLVADNIKNLAGASTFQTADGGASSPYNVTPFTTAMSTDFAIPTPTLAVTWSISGSTGLSAADLAMFTINPSSDLTQATLTSTGSAATDGTITLQAVYGTTTLSFPVTVKGSSIAGVKATLLTEIGTATTTNAAIAAAINPYVDGAKGTLTAAIATAQSVNDNSTVSADVVTATSTLHTAEAAFSAAMTSYNAFVAFIGTTQATHDAEVRTANFFVTVKGTLQTAINAANATLPTLSVAADITAAQSTLQGALTQFTTDIPAYNNLQTQISTVASRLTAVNPRMGDTRFLMFPTATVGTLSAANATATGLLASLTAATDLITAQTNLTAALTTFNAADRVTPGTQHYRIYTYGVYNGDGDLNKKIVYALGTVLKYALPTNAEVTASPNNALWTIVETSTGNYTFQNVGTGAYLNGTDGLSTTSTTFTLPEGTSSTGLINQTGTTPADSYFSYNLVTPTNRSYALQVGTYDAVSLTGIFLDNSTAATRFRFCFQFEQDPMVTVNYLDQDGAPAKAPIVVADQLAGSAYTPDYTNFWTFDAAPNHYVYSPALNTTLGGTTSVTVATGATVNLYFQRTALTPATYSWTGLTNGNWNELDGNFSTDGSNSIAYQNGNGVVFGANATTKTVSLAGGYWPQANNVTITDDGYSINGSGSLNGTGKVNVNLTTGQTATLNFTNNMTGGLEVSGGTAVIGTSAVTGPVLVDAAGTLAGTGTVSGATTVNGTLAGSLNFSSSLTLAGTTNIVVNGFAAGQFDVVNVTGALNYGGTLAVTVNGGNPTAGTTIKVLNFGSYAGNIVLSAPANYSFDNTTGNLTYNGTVVTGLNGKGVAELSIYPTLSHGFITIAGANASSVDFVNNAGQLVKHVSLTNGKTTISLNDLSAGAYLVKVKSLDGTVKVQKVIYQK